MSSLAATVKSNHPLKPLGRRYAPPTKKPPAWATKWIFSLAWLGWRDSNPRMPGPEPGALPLGDIPMVNEKELLELLYYNNL